MVKFFLIAFLFTSFVSIAQPTRTVTKTIKRANNFPPYTEKYSVLKEDGTTRLGLYEQYDNSGRILVRGYYKNGKKDSIWTGYDIWRDFIVSEGYYHLDKKAGTWTFNKDKDTIELRYDFDKNEVLYCKPDTSKKIIVLSGADTI